MRRTVRIAQVQFQELRRRAEAADRNVSQQIRHYIRRGLAQDREHEERAKRGG